MFGSRRLFVSALPNALKAGPEPGVRENADLCTPLVLGAVWDSV